MIYISNKAAEALDAHLCASYDAGAIIPAKECFNHLDEMFNLVPDQSIDGGTYVWVCDYAGGKFYTKITPDHIWLQDGI